MNRFLLSLIILCFVSLPSLSAIKGGIDYQIPIDYSAYNKAELEPKAEYYYEKALQTKKLDENMVSALNLYTMLVNAFPENAEYALRLGKLYDVLGKDKYAKGQYYHAMGLNHANPDPYFYLGNFFFDREQYRKALKFYKKAYDKGYSNHAKTKEQINLIYKKLGDKSYLK